MTLHTTTTADVTQLRAKQTYGQATVGSLQPWSPWQGPKEHECGVATGGQLQQGWAGKGH